MRILRAAIILGLCAALLVLLSGTWRLQAVAGAGWPLNACRAAEDEPPEQQPPPEQAPPPEPPPEEPPPAEPPAEPEETPADDAGSAAEPDTADSGTVETAPPEGVRRRRPQTAEEERAYKQRKSREDPFLNPPAGLADPAAGELYNVRDWLTGAAVPSVSRYLVQDASGKVLGYTSLQVELTSDPLLGEAVLLTELRDFGTPATLKLQLLAETLQPRRKELLQRPAAAGDGSVVDLGSSHLSVDYLFDRVTVTQAEGGVTVSHQLRQLPLSFDIDELPLLLRLLDFKRSDWPFEAAVTDPAQLAKLALVANQPVYADVLSAEPQSYGCFAFELHLGEELLRWAVQRRAPHILVRFERGGLTYTLIQYSEAKPA